MPMLSILAAITMTLSSAAADPLPVRGLHLFAPGPSEVARTVDFIKQALPKEGVNTLILEFDFAYQFKKRPEMVDDNALSHDQMRQLSAACKEAKVRLIPQINLLGHQSWAKRNGKLLREHPEFDETPGKYPDNKDIYCRSYCPNHPKVHDVLFDCIDELVEACEADAFHVGMDEVFIIGDKDCARCKDKSAADLFAGEVNKLHGHLKSKGIEMWMWGDRFLEGSTTGLGEWEAATNKTEGALGKIPKDIVICDWHYEKAEPTAPFFAMNGFRVASCPWRQIPVAMGQLSIINNVRANANKTLAGRMVGMIHTTWNGAGAFIDGYNGVGTPSKEVQESVACFKELFKAIRG